MLPPSDGGRLPRLLLDGALCAIVAAGAAFVVFANRERPEAPWPARDVAASKSAVARDPLDPAAMRDLGVALDLSGDTAAADRVLSFVGERTRRDTATSAWLLVRRLSQGRYDAAFASADALLRRDLDEPSRERMFKLLIAAAHYDVSRPALVGRLADAPWWRLPYMREMAAVADTEDSRKVFAGLAATKAAPTPPELDAYLTRLVANKDYAAAARDWRAFSRPHHDPDAIGDLAAPPPFGWSPVFGEGASSAVEDGALRVDYDGYGSAHLPTRLIALPTGRYALRWRERVTGDDIRAIGVTVVCGETGPALATSIPLASGSAPREQRLDVDIPPTGCEGQSVSITPVPGDRSAAATALFDHWSLTPRMAAKIPRR